MVGQPVYCRNTRGKDVNNYVQEKNSSTIRIDDEIIREQLFIVL